MASSVPGEVQEGGVTWALLVFSISDILTHTPPKILNDFYILTCGRQAFCVASTCVTRGCWKNRRVFPVLWLVRDSGDSFARSRMELVANRELEAPEIEKRGDTGSPSSPIRGRGNGFSSKAIVRGYDARCSYNPDD
jgi:hypothetical protein